MDNFEVETAVHNELVLTIFRKKDPEILSAPSELLTKSATLPKKEQHGTLS